MKHNRSLPTLLATIRRTKKAFFLCTMIICALGTTVFISTPAVAQDDAPEIGTTGRGQNNTKHKSSFGLQVDVHYPQVIGRSAQNFTGRIGFTARAYLPGFLGDMPVEPFILGSFQALKPLSLTEGAFNLIPVIVGFEVKGKTPISGLSITADLGAGGTFGWIQIPNSNANNFRVSGYFSVYLEPGMSYEISPGMEIRAQMPVNFLIGQRLMEYLTWSGGFRFYF